MSSSAFPSSPPRASSSSRLRPRRSRERSSSQAALGLESSQNEHSVVIDDDDGGVYDNDGQDLFKDLELPPLDDPDDLSYEDSDAGGNGDGADEQRSKGKAKEKRTERVTESRERRTTPSFVEQEDPLSEDYGSVTTQEEDDDDDNDDDDDDDEPNQVEDRPNRFHGPSKTWQAWTKQERLEFNAMEKIRARDLSAHLFNAFALKKRARAIRSRLRAAEGNAPDPGAAATGLEQELTGYPGGEGTDPAFAPPKGWTAWPLPADIVPRVDEHRFRDEEDAMWTIRMTPDGRPSAELEECLMAEMLKAAKERFYARDWVDEGENDRAGPSRHGSRAPTVASAKDDETSGKEWSDFDEGVRDRDEEGSFAAPTLRPVVMADDERARTVLRPAARHILAKFDELLMGLHRARQAYATMGGRPKMDPDGTEAEDSAGESGPRKRRKTKSTTTAPDVDVPTEREDVGNPHSRRRRGKSRSNYPRLEPTVSQLHRHGLLGRRDWSDVLGVASMTGWAPAAVMRAARRCADLFGEDMVFRTMDEGTLHLERDADDRPVWKYIEGDGKDDLEAADVPAQSVERAKTKTSSVPEYIGPLKQYARYCPVQECPRHTRGFSRTWNLNKHLKNRHPDLYRERTVIKSDTDTAGP
ncbi:hypothetical protein VTO42DRAFT_4926 [Malbranchea cinnamomea]